MKQTVNQLAAAFVLSAAIPALGATIEGVKLDDKTTLAGQELVLNGAGMRSRIVFKVYVGALYLPQKTSSVQEIVGKNQPRRMMLVLQRDVNADMLLESVRAGLADNNSQADLDKIRPQIEEFAGIFKSVGEAKSGQIITIDYTPADGTHIALDGASKGTIAGEPFNKALFNSWLGTRPVQESLKKALLGAG